jgi:hypothetical protein
MSCPCAWLPADEAGWGAAAKLLMQLRTKRHPTWEQPLPPLLLGLTPYTLLQKLLLLLRREKRLALPPQECCKWQAPRKPSPAADCQLTPAGSCSAAAGAHAAAGADVTLQQHGTRSRNLCCQHTPFVLWSTCRAIEAESCAWHAVAAWQ